MPQRLFIPAALLSVLLSGCFSGPLGSACDGEGGCDFGLRCFQPNGFRAGICTVRCEDTCEQGTCVPTEHGTMCATPCRGAGSCDAGLACQTAPGAPEPVCWGPDENLTPIEGEDPLLPPVSGPAKITIDRVEVVNDTNGDGLLNPGEEARLRIFVVNGGADPAEGVFGEVSSSSALVAIDDCNALGSSSCAGVASDRCSCAENTWDYYEDIAGGTVPGSPLVMLDVVVDPAAQGEVVLTLSARELEGDGTWVDTVAVPLTVPDTLVHIERIEIVNDTNKDQLLNPGEDARIRVFVANRGSAEAIRLWAEATASPPVVIDECSAVGSSTCRGGDATLCTCLENVWDYTLDLPPGDTSVSEPLVSLDLNVAAGTAPGELHLPMVFYDVLGNSWSDTLALALVPTNAAPAFDHVTTVNDDDGDGQLEVGETADLRIFVRNEGSSLLTDAWADVSVPAGLALVGCEALGSSTCRGPSTASSCSCVDNTWDYTLDVQPESVPSEPLVSVEVTASGSGSFSLPLTVHDSLGNSWSLSVPVTVF